MAACAAWGRACNRAVKNAFDSGKRFVPTSLKVDAAVGEITARRITTWLTHPPFHSSLCAWMVTKKLGSATLQSVCSGQDLADQTAGGIGEAFCMCGGMEGEAASPAGKRAPSTAGVRRPRCQELR